MATEPRDAVASLPRHFRRHAEALERSGRSPLYVALMRAAAADIESGGRVADLFRGAAGPPESVPSLRLLAALHHLVLAGRAPALAAFYPSAGGDGDPAGAWPAAREVLEANGDWVRERLRLPVQTNEPGRAAALFPALLWLTARYGMPIRLLEIGASAGLNLLADRFSYAVGGRELGAPGSPVRFEDPWRDPPALDLADADARLRIVHRAGCDPAPLDLGDPEARLRLLSYFWPDEVERLRRARAAIGLAAGDPPHVAAAPTEDWLPRALGSPRRGELTVVWQSTVRQYVDGPTWEAIEAAMRQALAGGPDSPVVWLRMEPGEDWRGPFRLTLETGPERSELLLARCGPHGPPVAWSPSAPPPTVV